MKEFYVEVFRPDLNRKDGATGVVLIDPVSGLPTSAGAPGLPTTVAMLTAVAATGAGAVFDGKAGLKSFQASGTVASGVGTAAIQVRGSNDGTAWVVLGTISLTLGVAVTSDGFTCNDRYRYLQGNVASITGTTPSVSLSMGA